MLSLLCQDGTASLRDPGAREKAGAELLFSPSFGREPERCRKPGEAPHSLEILRDRQLVEGCSSTRWHPADGRHRGVRSSCSKKQPQKGHKRQAGRGANRPLACQELNAQGVSPRPPEQNCNERATAPCTHLGRAKQPRGQSPPRAERSPRRPPARGRVPPQLMSPPSVPTPPPAARPGTLLAAAGLMRVVKHRSGFNLHHYGLGGSAAALGSSALKCPLDCR